MEELGVVKYDIEYGYCQCRCGSKAPLAKATNSKRGHIKGKPIRFIPFHHIRVQNPNWKGGTVLLKGGYPARLTKNESTRYKLIHREIAEKVVGKPLSSSVSVHHSNERQADFSTTNLVICESNSYHMLIHQRMRAYKASGHADWRKCKFCKKYDSPINLYIRNGSGVYHRGCMAKYARERKITNAK